MPSSFKSMANVIVTAHPRSLLQSKTCLVLLKDYLETLQLDVYEYKGLHP